ncbi:hypothetical protein ColLi_02634 [Colletotrichum liriopes]|uniref:DUF7357 domain-containing protein n=1 Tax=Colletotrichum liriopes TaxID=708192 RepID=A0AA37LPI4_9PEZI|nr:hypothetical protein ColLi_02634 [Colletotrichum liriopes]
MEKDLRLRLVVRRHGVPDVKLLWNATADEDLTISKLLTQVNEVIPLESGEWGLEDYAVELKDASGDGFECVHYHLVSKVLKDDDQVLSEDEEDTPSDNDEELPMLEYGSTRAQEDPASVKLRTRFYDADSDSNSEEEEDFEPAPDGIEDDDMDSEDGDIQDELRLLREDNAAIREGDILEELRDIRDRRASSGPGSGRRSLGASGNSPTPSASNALVRSGGRAARHRLNLDTLDKIAALRAAFPGAQVSVIEETLLRYDTDSAKAYRKLRKAFTAHLSLQQTLDHQARSLSSSPIRHAHSSAGRELVLRESSPSERASHATAHGEDDEDDDENASTTLNHNTLADRDSGTAKKCPSEKRAAVSISSSDSSSDSSSAESSSDESSSDSEPEEIPSKTLSSQRQILEPSQPQTSRKVFQATTAAAAAPAQEQPNVPPGQGLSKTQKRNARRKLAKQLAAGKSTSAQGSEEPSQAPDTGVSVEEAAFLARKQALLNAIASDGPVDPFSQETFQGILDSAPQAMELEQPSATTADAAEPSKSSAAQTEEVSAQRRMRPNIGATRRMLMGSLGLKNPKTKADEDKIRQDLMKGVRPHTNARLAEASSQPDGPAQTQEPVQEDPEAWREKIAYRAVECCHDGIELSEPPFPFVQRWDPQQQVEEWFGSNAQYYEDGDSQASKKRRVTGDSVGVTFSDAVESLEEGDTTLNYDDPPDEPPVVKAAAEGSQATDIDDLPSLPSDLTTLPDLGPGEAKLGMVITWKQWLLSSATNWQPEVVNLTGILVRVHDEDATDLEFLLAQRDRDVDKTEKKYDEDTGQRVYDRFEAPDDDDDADDEPDQGYRRLKYTDLIEPKIVQLPLEDQGKTIGNEDSSAAPTDSIVHETVYDDQSQPPQTNGENAGQSEADVDGSQLLVDAKDGRAKANTDDAQPQVITDSDPRLDATAGNNQPSHNPDTQGDDAEDIDEANVPTPRRNSFAKDGNPAPATEDADSQKSNGNALTISPDRRHEISIMIQEAGFRKDVSPSIIRQKTSSPSRQLLEMLEAANNSRVASRSPLSQESMAKDATPVLDNEPGSSAGVTGAGTAAPASSTSSIRSGRQFDPDDYGLNMGGEDLQHMSDIGDASPLADIDASTPKAKAQTPTRAKKDSDSPSTDKSFPSLASLARTASQQNLQKQTQSPSKSQVLPTLASHNSAVQCDEDYEAAMRLIDENDDDDDAGEDEPLLELRSTRKRLFPNSSQPDQLPLSESADLPGMKPVLKSASSPIVEKQDDKPFLRKRERKSSSFVIPPGSQVVTLSSSPPDSPLQEVYAEDGIDADYQDDNKISSLPHGSGWVQKTKPSRVSSRAKSMPANQGTTRSASARRPIPPSSLPAKPGARGKGQRKPSTKF